jgi:hypothetical protein
VKVKFSISTKPKSNLYWQKMKVAEYCLEAIIIGILILVIALVPLVQAQEGSTAAVHT